MLTTSMKLYTIKPRFKSTEEYVNPCRVITTFKTPKDFVLESDKEYPLYEEIYKRGKTSYRELGKIRIE